MIKFLPIFFVITLIYGNSSLYALSPGNQRAIDGGARFANADDPIGQCAVGIPSIDRGEPEENYQNTWDYFVGTQGLSPEAAAGLMGTLEKESGIDPWNTQNDAPVPDGPEIPIDSIRNSYGYGILQWTSAGRQQGLIDLAQSSQPPRSTGSLDLQLEYLWQELNSGAYEPTLSTLFTPGVTIEEAADIVTLDFTRPGAVLPEYGGTDESRATELSDRRTRAQVIYNTYSGQEAGSFSTSFCAAGGITIDPDAPDTSNIPCAPGSTDQGVTQGYSRGVQRTIRICRVENANVGSALSGPLIQMLADARSQGVNLTMNGSFRTMEGQIAIYNNWCANGGITPTPPPYPKASYDEYTRCPGGAAPGWSNHQTGLAIDMECDGTLITRWYEDAVNNECFNWLVANAGNYGLYEFGKGQSRDSSGYEAWHWSVDGR